MGQFGDKFRKAREAKELTLDDVSNVTKIGPRMLQAIEEENFDRLPGGVFNKGFIRAYAKHLGLDPEVAITEYLDCLRQAQVVAQQAWDPAPQTEVRPAPSVKVPKEGPKTSRSGAWQSRAIRAGHSRCSQHRQACDESPACGRGRGTTRVAITP